jgi:AraC family transcriptional regulator
MAFTMIFPLAKDHEKHLLDLDHATYAVYKKEAGAICWGGRLLSLKVAFNGQANFYLENTAYSLEKGVYLILNADKEYNIIKDTHESVEMLSIYFDSGFAKDTFRSLRTDTGDLLDVPYPPSGAEINFIERVYPHDNDLTAKLFTLRRVLQLEHYTLPWLEEQFHSLLESMVNIHLKVHSSLKDLTSVRRSLREELYRRVYRARDFAAASLDRELTIQEMAEVAQMSPSHFLRTFKLLFQTTPYKYLRQKRMERAGYMLRNYDISVTEVCHSVGFRSLSNFSWEFRKWYGVSPRGYRLRDGDF